MSRWVDGWMSEWGKEDNVFEELQKLLGHKSSKTAGIYTHVSKSSIGKIISPLDKLGEEESDK